MPKLRGKKILAPEKEILAFPDHYVTLPGKIAYATLKTVAAADNDFDGVKTLKKGTVIKMDADGVITAAGDADGNGIVFNTIKLDDYDLARLEPIDDFLTRRCEEIYNKSEKHLQLLKILLIDC